MSVDADGLYRTGIAAGSPVPDEVMRKIMRRLNLTEQTIAYGESTALQGRRKHALTADERLDAGQTETSPVTFQTATDDPLEKRVVSLSPASNTPTLRLGAAHGRTGDTARPSESSRSDGRIVVARTPALEHAWGAHCLWLHATERLLEQPSGDRKDDEARR